MAPRTGGGGSVRPGTGGGGGGGGTAVGRVLNSIESAFFLSCKAFANASRTTFSISGVSFAVGLFSTSKPLLDRCSTIVEVATLSSFATLISRLLIRSFKHGNI